MGLRRRRDDPAPEQVDATSVCAGHTLGCKSASPGEKGPISIVRADGRRLINRNGSEPGYVYEVASFNKANPRSEIFALALRCIEDARLPRFRHTGEEILPTNGVGPHSSQLF